MDADIAILYVEDDPMSRQVMELLLVRKMHFKQVTIFETSDDFMNRLRALPKKPQVFLLDIHIEPLDGFELIHLLRSDPDYSQARIVALTASVMNEEVNQLKRAGFDGVLAKPVDQLAFPDTFNRILNGEHIWNVT